MSTRVFILAALTAITVLVAVPACSKNKKPNAAMASDSSANANRGKGKTPVQMSGTNKNGDTVSLDAVYFEFDSSEIQSQYRDSLGALARHMKANPKFVMTVEGHCDETGTVEYNIALGDRRARAIKSYLETLGVKETRVSIISYGKERPAATGKDEENRRGMLLDRSR